MTAQKPRLVIEARTLSGSSGGVRSYTQELIKNILVLNTSYSIDILHSNESTPFSGAGSHRIPLRNEAFLPLWLHRNVPRLLSQLQPSLVHFTKADVPSKKLFPTVVTIYDVIPLLLPNTQSPLRRIYWPRALARAAAQSDHIMTISQASKQGIVDYLGVSPGKITVTEPGVDFTHFKPMDLTQSRNILQQYKISLPYILFVGTRDGRKNIAALLQAFHHLKNEIPHNLIIVGRPGDKRVSTEHVVHKLGLRDRVHFLGRVTHEHLPALYSAAEMFVWPSIYEGWGLPPVEAMACGTPVISSDGGSLPEAVGDGGIVVPFSESDVAKRHNDTDFVKRLGDQMSRVLADSELREQLRQKGFTHVAKFSWKTAAERTLAVYDQVAVG